MDNQKKIMLLVMNVIRGMLYRLALPVLIIVSASGTHAKGLATDYVAVPPLVDVSASSDKPNVLVVLDNSNSMDEAANGSAVGSANSSSKSEIARGAVKTIINNFGDASRLGLMAYKQSSIGTRRIHNSPYDVSYNPANYDPTYDGSRDSSTKKYRIPNPSNPGAYIYYNIALPFYSGSNQGNRYCYSSTADFDNGSESVGSGPWDYYSCYKYKKDTSDIFDVSSTGFSGSAGGGSFYPTDSDYAQGILDFGRFMTWHYVGKTWFSNSSPGKGMLHVEIDDVDASHKTKLLNKLATSQFSSSTDTPLRNAGLTPIAGTLNSAKSYFQGALPSSETASGASNALPPGNVCGSNNDYVVFVTDGLPSVDASGNKTSDTAVAIAAAATAAKDLYENANVKTFVVGFALPNGVDGTVLDQIASAGGTGTASLADDEASLNQALGSIFLSIVNRSSSSTGAAVLANNTRGEGAVYQAIYNPHMEDADGREVNWVGGLHGLFIDQLGYLREDTNGNKALDGYNTDKVIEYYYDASENRTRIKVFVGASASVAPDTDDTPSEIKEVSDLNVLWQARDQLASLSNITLQRDFTASAATGRYIVTSSTGTGLTDFITMSPIVLAALADAESDALTDLNTAKSDVASAEALVVGAELTRDEMNDALSGAQFEEVFRNDISTSIDAFYGLENADMGVNGASGTLSAAQATSATKTGEAAAAQTAYDSALLAASGNLSDPSVVTAQTTLDTANTGLSDAQAAEVAAQEALDTANATYATAQGSVDTVKSDKELVANVIVAEQAIVVAQQVAVTANATHDAKAADRVAKDALAVTAQTNYNGASTAADGAQTAYNGSVTSAATAKTANDGAVTAAGTSQANYNTVLAAAGGNTSDPTVVAAQAALDSANQSVTDTNNDLVAANQAVVDRQADLDAADTVKSDAQDDLNDANTVASDAKTAEDAASDVLDDANQDITDANDQLDQAQIDQDAYYGKGNIDVDVEDLITAQDEASLELDAAVLAAEDAGGSVTEANGDLVNAQATLATANAAQVAAQSAFNSASLAALNSTFLNYLMDTGGTEANKLVNYIRGEEQAGYRSRTIDIDGDGSTEVWRLGDIVHSTPALVGAPNDSYDSLYNDTTYAAYREQYKNRRQVVYVGANDGMLHAFNAGFWNESDKKFELDEAFSSGSSSITAHPLGSELWSYIPRSVLPHLKWLKDSGYAHSYYVDGAPTIFDANVFTADADHPYGWGTVMVIGLRFGGGEIDVDSNGDGTTDATTYSSYVIMDVTNPEAPPSLMAEISHSELGFTTSRPAVVKKRISGTGISYTSTTSNSWQLVFGSGPTELSDATSTQTAKLFVYDLAAKSFVTGFAPKDLSSHSNSFIGDIGVANWDNDFVDDTAYFGVVAGSTSSPTGQVLRFRLDQSAGSAISTFLDTDRATVGRPLPVRDGSGRQWVYFGTGRLFDGDDNISTPLQRYYGVMEPIDTSGVNTWASADADTLEDVSNIRIFDNGDLTSTSGTVEIPSGSTITTYNALKSALPKYKGGWFRDLYTQSSEPSGRNVTAAAKARSIIFFTEYKPSANTCQPEGTSSLYGVDYQTGTAVPFAVFGVNSSITSNSGDLSEAALGLGQGMASAPVVINNNSGSRSGTSDSVVSILTQSSTGVLRIDLAKVGTYATGRQSWVEIELD